MQRSPRPSWTLRYVNWLYSHRVKLNVFAAVLTLASIALASKLQIKSSLSELLPQNLPSVVQLNRVLDRIGGTGYLLIAVESPDFPANKRFVEDLAGRIEKEIPKSEVRYIEYRFKEARDYIEKYGLHYLNEQQLIDLKDGLHKEIDKKKGAVFSSFLGLDDEPKEDKKDVREMLTSGLDTRVQRFLQYPDAYIGTDDGKMLVIRVMSAGSSVSIKSAKALTKAINDIVASLNPASYNPGMKIGFAGTIQRNLDEHDTIKHDVGDTSIELVILVLGVLVAYFWSPRWIILLFANLFLGVAWTFGFTKLAIGYLNTQTAFLGSLVVGTGINYGVIMLSRYLEERRKGNPLNESVITAVRSTAIATLLASSTTAVSFASLLVADNKGLSQFGFIGCVGILFCWIAAYSMLPVWLLQWENWKPIKSYKHPFAATLRPLGEGFGNLMVRGTPVLTVFLVLASVLGIYGFRQLAKEPLEYDFTKLQIRSSTNQDHGIGLHLRIQEKVFKSNLSVGVILGDTPEEAKEICPKVRAIAAALPPEKRVFESCVTLWDLMPPEHHDPAVEVRERKLRSEIKTLLADRTLKFADPTIAGVIDRVKTNLSLDPPKSSELPRELTRRFEERDGTLGMVGFITPQSDKTLDDARNLFNYTDAFSQITLPTTGATVEAAGDAWIFADLLRTIRTDGPQISAIAFCLVILLTFLLSGSVRGGLLMAGCLTLATWWQLCYQGFFDIKFNFFNFIALPITFGIGVDYPVNVYLRAREDKFRDFGSTFATTGIAVMLCSMTTIFGYYTLLGASNQAVTSFAKLAILGELSCALSAIVFLPVALTLLGKYRRDLATDK